MKRTLATINTVKGIAALIHDSKTKELTANFADGSVEQINDYTPTAYARDTQRQIIAMYSCSASRHDSWVLCLRPLKTLDKFTSEAGAR